jgi:hypothetical protein
MKEGLIESLQENSQHDKAPEATQSHVLTAML